MMSDEHCAFMLGTETLSQCSYIPDTPLSMASLFARARDGGVVQRMTVLTLILTTGSCGRCRSSERTWQAGGPPTWRGRSTSSRPRSSRCRSPLPATTHRSLKTFYTQPFPYSMFQKLLRFCMRCCLLTRWTACYASSRSNSRGRQPAVRTQLHAPRLKVYSVSTTSLGSVIALTAG